MDEKLAKIQKLLDAAEGNLASARNMLREYIGKPATINSEPTKEEAGGAPEMLNESIIEGVFNGEEMIASDGKNYPVPANYASKSKLVEGDGLKLTIAADGSFIFKQIRPAERKSLVGTLSLDGSSYVVLAEGKKYKVLTASITFYKAEPGDSVTVLLPAGQEASWAALENVISKGANIESADDTSEKSTPTEITTPETIMEPAANIEVPEVQTTPAVETETEVTTEPAVAPEPVKEDPLAPKIEFSQGDENLSDEQLLENLKNNLKNITTPEFVSPTAAQLPPDGMVASDLSAVDSTPTPNKQDQPIAELEI